jgi:two-component system cell cycle sensor histidine kinase/response regulator CckA
MGVDPGIAGSGGVRGAPGGNGFALPDSEDLYRTLFERANDAIAIFDAGSFDLIAANPKTCDLYGYSLAELSATPIEALIPDLSRAQAAIESTIAAGTTEGIEDTHLRSDGRSIHVLINAARVDFGQRQAILVVIRDITALKAHAAELSRSISLLQATLESTGEGILVLDNDQNVVLYNQRLLDLWDLDEDQLRGSNGPRLRESVRGKLNDAEETLRRAEEVYSEPEGETYDSASLRNGRIIERVSRPQKMDGRTVGRVSSFRDVTARTVAERERQALELQLRHVQKLDAIGVLAGGIAHDFNNILYAITGFGELVLEELPHGGQAWQDQQEVLTAARRAAELVRQILTFSRKSEGRRIPVNVLSIIKEVGKLMRASLPVTIEIATRIEAADAMVLADPIDLHQVLMNLCANAGFAMREAGGVLELSLRTYEISGPDLSAPPDLPPGSYYVVGVADTGEGIPAENLERLWEPFFTTKDVGEGTGLGLPTVHGIVAALGGSVTVQSKVGVGTTFAVYLPVSEGTAPPLRPAAVRAGTERVLFIDDEVVLARMGKRMLEQYGYTVTACTSSIDAFALFERHPEVWDVVITDDTMPKLTGGELAARIGALRPQLPIILCTGFSQHVDSDSLPDPVRKLLIKPITLSELTEAIRGVVDGTGP